MRWGKDRAVCFLKNRKNTLYLVLMKDVDKNLTTKLRFQPAVRLCVLSSV